MQGTTQRARVKERRGKRGRTTEGGSVLLTLRPNVKPALFFFCSLSQSNSCHVLDLSCNVFQTEFWQCWRGPTPSLQRDKNRGNRNKEEKNPYIINTVLVVLKRCLESGIKSLETSQKNKCRRMSANPLGPLRM